MDEEIKDYLVAKSNDELVAMVTIHKNEYDAEFINFINEILKFREISPDLYIKQKEEEIQKDPNRVKEGDKKIKSLLKKSIIYSILFLFNIVLIIAILINIQYGYDVNPLSLVIRFIVLILFGNLLFLSKFRLNNLKLTKRTLDNTPPKHLRIVLGLGGAVKNAKKNSAELTQILENEITITNYQEVLNNYKKEYYIGFKADLFSVINDSHKLKEVLQPLINKGILEGKYPFDDVE